MTETSPSSVEKILWSGTVSHFHYLGKWLLAIALLAGAGASFALAFPNQPGALWIIRGTLFLLTFFLIGWIYLDRSRRRYAVTDKRVSVEFGIVAKSSNEVRIQDIRSINLTRTGMSGLLGVGRVEFSSAATDDADVIFWNTPEAEKVRDLVRSLQK
jgi:uncharacterized membrane protein YdbT with pleckstrin-like domain